MQHPEGFRVGDKVRVRAGPNAGVRAIIRAAADGLLEVETAVGDVLLVSANDVTNYSLAARRAWQVMPKRAGRPPADSSRRKKMVSLRLDEDVWNRLGVAAEFGLIPSREQAVNSWLRDRLDDLAIKLPLLGSRGTRSQN